MTILQLYIGALVVFGLLLFLSRRHAEPMVTRMPERQLKRAQAERRKWLNRGNIGRRHGSKLLQFLRTPPDWE
jgi:hypothetical protein